MATAAQITANRLNAQASTGPVTDSGKAASAANSTTHGLSSQSFAVLPTEDPAAFETLLRRFEAEYRPETASEDFLVTELAQAQWKIQRIQAIEAELLIGSSDGPWAAIAARFRDNSSAEQALLKLDRYAQSARRAWHHAFNQLRKIRAGAESSAAREASARRKDSEAMLEAFLNAPIPMPSPQHETKPMPVHLQRELDAHRRRDPLFDPKQDRSQMSKQLRKWFA